MRPIVISRMKKRDPLKKAVSRYVRNWVRHPDKRGSFYKKTRFISWLPGPVLISLMKKLKYDGILFEKEGKIAANIFFQRHGDTLHMFAIAVESAFENQGIAKQSVRYLIEHARSVRGITRLRIGAGRDPIVTSLYEGLRNDKAQLEIKVLKDGWVELK